MNEWAASRKTPIMTPKMSTTAHGGKNPQNHPIERPTDAFNNTRHDGHTAHAPTYLDELGGGAARGGEEEDGPHPEPRGPVLRRHHPVLCLVVCGVGVVVM